MLQNLQNIAKFQNFQLDNLVDFEKCRKTRIYMQRSVPIQPKTSECLPKICQKVSSKWTGPEGQFLAQRPADDPRQEDAHLAHQSFFGAQCTRLCPGSLVSYLAKLANLLNLQIFGGLVLSCIETKFCKKICVWQHFSSSTIFAYFCTAAILKFSQKKIGLKNSNFGEISAKNCKCRKTCKILPNFKNFSLIIW